MGALSPVMRRAAPKCAHKSPLKAALVTATLAPCSALCHFPLDACHSCFLSRVPLHFQIFGAFRLALLWFFQFPAV